MSINDIVAVPSQTDPLKGDGGVFGPANIPSVRQTASIVNVAVIDSRNHLRECIVRHVAKNQFFAAAGYSSVEEFINREGPREGPYDHTIAILCSVSGAHYAALSEVSMLRSSNSSCQTVVLADTNDHGLVNDFLRHGARGVIPMVFPASIVVEALQLVLAGGTFIPFESFFAGPQNNVQRAVLGNYELTNREEQIVSLLQSGKPNKQIAYELGLSIGTVKVHLHNIMNKLGAHNRIQVLAYQGLIAAPQQTGPSRPSPVLIDTGTIADLVQSATAEANIPR